MRKKMRKFDFFRIFVCICADSLPIKNTEYDEKTSSAALRPRIRRGVYVQERDILEAIGEREPKVDIVSCPTCGRTRIDLESLADEVEKKLSEEPDLPKGLKVAVMGCVVNGPGEAREADFGVCGGDRQGLIIRKGEIVKKAREEDLADELMNVIREAYA